MAKNTFNNPTKEKVKPKVVKEPIKLAINEKQVIAFGLIFIVTSIFLLFAFGSYIFSGNADQSIINSNGFDLKKNSADVQNMAGYAGAIISDYFIFKWFGLGAFLLIPFLFISGVKLTFKKQLFELNKFTWGTVFYMLWTGVFLAYWIYVFELQINFSWVCGGIGYAIMHYGYNYLGWFLIFILFLILAIFVVLFHNKIHWLNANFGTNFKTNEISNQEIETEKAIYTRNTDTWEEEFEGLKEKTTQQDFFEEKEVKENPFSLAPSQKIIEPKKELILEVQETEPDDEIEEELIIEKITADDSSEPNAADLVSEFGQYDSTLDLPKYQFPSADLLTDYKTEKPQVTEDELGENSKKIVETLRNYGIGIAHIKATIGPTVTLYEIIPEAGVRISKIKSLEDDIALSLAALGIRIIAPIPGKGTVGIEVPNKNKEMVPMKALITSEKFQKANMELPIVLGKTINNEIFVTDLAKMPHLLMAGATGQGKSVGLNVIIASLIYKKHPSQLKFVMVDPKKVELTLFNKLERHFLAMLPGEAEPIITNTKKVVNTLNSLCIEMDNRYNLLKDAGCRNLKEYNAKFVNRKLNPEKGHHYLPYIVLVIDELADLMMTAGKEVEQPIARLAQLARAVGIHLIVATQRPSVNVITGIIKANFPARLSFKVTSKIDSRTILDAGGADQLVGQGDMLLSQGSDIMRLQCAFIDTPEVDAVCDFIGEQQGYSSAYMLPEFEGDESGNEEKASFDPSNRDPYFDEAARLLVTHQQGSTSLIQRRLKLGYNRAGRLIDQLEAASIVGPFEGSKAREVLFKDMVSLEEYLKNL